MSLDKPNNSFGEITIIGTGGGYGESCVLHLGEQKWVVIDSCIDPNSRKSLPLAYLEQVGVNLGEDVELILCTHWHDDHILGISDLLKKCVKAKFSFAKANDLTKFLRMVALDYQKLLKGSTNSSTFEFNQCLEIIEKRKSNHQVLAYPDRVLLSINYLIYQNEVIALSPSDAAIKNFDHEISSLITEYGKTNRRIIPLSPNFNSVVVLLKLGPHRALLGADLGVSKSNKMVGWDCIIEQSQTIDKASAYFKIPHHGSINSFHETLWENRFLVHPISTITPWNRGLKLPTRDMVEKYKSLSKAVFITSVFSKSKPKKRDKVINKMIEDFKIDIEEIPFKYGIIRSRIDMSDKSADWAVDCFGTSLIL